jgi:hypothetical protein
MSNIEKEEKTKATKYKWNQTAENKVAGEVLNVL